VDIYDKLKNSLLNPNAPPPCPPYLERSIACNIRGITSRITVSAEAQRRLHNRKAWLNDEAINSIAQLIQCTLLRQRFFSNSHNCAIFGSHIFTLASHNSDIKTVHRNSRETIYWKRRIWIFPIHRPAAHHWVLAFVVHRRRTIFVYDSLGMYSPEVWQDDLRVCPDAVNFTS
jgi:Ulp1 family protease